MSEAKDSEEGRVKQVLPNAVCVADYNDSDCWSTIYPERDEDGFGTGEPVGHGQFNDEAWKNAARNLEAAGLLPPATQKLKV